MASQNIRHKARQKAIHNARRGRGSTRGRQFPHSQPSRDNTQHYRQGPALRQAEQLTGGRFNPNIFDSSASSGFGAQELKMRQRIDLDGLSETDFSAAEDLLVNVQAGPLLESKGNIEDRPAKIMFTMREALAIYKDMWDAGFPLLPGKRERFLLPGEVLLDSKPLDTHVSLPTIDQLGTNSTSNIQTDESRSARDYTFDFGKYLGQRFSDAPEPYLRTLSGRLSLMDSRHPGLKEAFEYHRPQPSPTVHIPQRPKKTRQAQSRQPASQGGPVAQVKAHPDGRVSNIRRGRGGRRRAKKDSD